MRWTQAITCNIGINHNNVMKTIATLVALLRGFWGTPLKYAKYCGGTEPFLENERFCFRAQTVLQPGF